MDAAAFCARWDRRAGSYGPVSDQQHADERRVLRTAKSCGPDAPTLASSLRKACRPYRARTSHISAGDGGKRARSPGRARNKLLKPLRAGMPGVPVDLWRLPRVPHYTLHTRLRVQRAPGIPHALYGGERFYVQLGRTASRDHERVSGIRVPSLRAKRSNPYFLCCEMDCFASLAMTATTEFVFGCLKMESGISTIPSSPA